MAATSRRHVIDCSERRGDNDALDASFQSGVDDIASTVDRRLQQVVLIALDVKGVR